MIRATRFLFPKRCFTRAAAQEGFKLALTGRPNVGKSTLFNRLTRTRKAIVTAVPGTTRDRREARANFAGFDFSVVDTGGLEDATMGSLEHKMLEQTKYALTEADIIFFMLDIFCMLGAFPVKKY